MTSYRAKILALLNRMDNACSRLRGPNMAAAIRYMAGTRSTVEAMIHPFNGSSELLSLLPRFQGYFHDEETRLRQGFETAKYDIDALDTIAIINGRRALERVSLSTCPPKMPTVNTPPSLWNLRIFS